MILVENRKFLTPPVDLTPLLEGFLLELGTYTRDPKTRMMGLSDGLKSFKIGLAVLLQYRRVTDKTPSQPRCRSKDRAYVYLARVKTTDVCDS